MNITSSIYHEVLISPYQNGANVLNVVSRRSSAAFLAQEIVRLFGNKNIKSRLAKNKFSICMTTSASSKDSVDTIQIKALLDLEKIYPTILSIKLIPDSEMPDENIYVWETFGQVAACWTGKACFRYEHFMEISNPLTPSNVGNYLDKLANIPSLPTSAFVSDVNYNNLLVENIASMNLSLLNENGTVSLRSGLNWGKRFEHKRRENEAYISVPSPKARTGFFPSSGKYFTVLTDDNFSFIARIEQQNDKALTTPLDNSILGNYFRCRLGIPSGAEVKTLHLKEYKRSDVRFTKLDSETYFMDFSNS